MYPKQTDMATIVRFVKEKDGDITAVFPQLKYNKHLYGNKMLTCYVHMGQHSSCSTDWIEEKTKPATKKEYSDLKR